MINSFKLVREFNQKRIFFVFNASPFPNIFFFNISNQIILCLLTLLTRLSFVHLDWISEHILSDNCTS